jgi:hypothetical protein
MPKGLALGNFLVKPRLFQNKESDFTINPKSGKISQVTLDKFSLKTCPE